MVAPLIVAAGIGAAGSILGSALSGRASSRAASQAARTEKQIAAADRTQQWKMYQQGRRDNEQFYQRGRKDLFGGFNTAQRVIDPYDNHGPGAANKLADLAGVTGNGSAVRALAADPGYQFRLNQGISAADRGAAARGMLQSGAQAKALNDYGQGMASNELTNAYNRVNGVLGMAQQASTNRANLYSSQGTALGNLSQGQASGMQALTQNTGNQISNTYQGSAARQGQAILAGGQGRASAYQGAVSGINSGINNAMFAYGMQQGWFGNNGTGGGTNVAAPEYVRGGAL